MAHNVTNIESFEISVGMQYFAGQGLGFGGITTTTPTPQGFRLLQFGWGWQDLPMAFLSGGNVMLDPLSQRAAISRTYFSWFAPAPVNPTSIVAHVRTGVPTYIARVELDALLELSLNGVKSGAPTVLNPTPQFYRLELFTDAVNGIMELWIDGALEVQIVGVIGTSDYVQLGDERFTAGGGRLYDDVLVESSRTNPADIDFPGAGIVERFETNAVGTDNAWALVGAPNKWTAVNDTGIFPDGDVSYVHNAGAAVDQTFANWTRANVAPANPPSLVLGPGEGFRAVKVCSVVRGTGGGVGWRYVRTRSGGTIDETTVLNQAFAVYNVYGSKVYQTDPNTGAVWTPAAADALEAGCGIDNVNTGRNTALVVQMERGIPFPVGRARINPSTLVPGAVEMLNAGRLGG